MSKFSCDTCLYYTNNRANFIKHCNTQKHSKNLDKQIDNKKYNYIECLQCNYITCIEKEAKEHANMNNHTYNISYICNSKNEFKCENCNKTYKFLSGYYRHKKKCIKSDITDIANILQKTTDINTKLYDKINKLENTQNNIVTNTINNNITNNKLDIHLYLNTEYKNAMNLSEFVDKIKLSLDDLLYTRNNGYVKGITNIFVKNL